MVHEGGQVKVSEEVAIRRVEGVCNLVCLLRAARQLLHLGHEQRICALVGACARGIGEHVRGIALQ